MEKKPLLKSVSCLPFFIPYCIKQGYHFGIVKLWYNTEQKYLNQREGKTTKLGGWIETLETSGLLDHNEYQENINRFTRNS